MGSSYKIGAHPRLNRQSHMVNLTWIGQPSDIPLTVDQSAILRLVHHNLVKLTPPATILRRGVGPPLDIGAAQPLLAASFEELSLVIHAGEDQGHHRRTALDCIP